MKPLASFDGQQTQFEWPRDRHTLVDFDGPAAVLAVQNRSTLYVGVVVDEAEHLRRWLVVTLDAPQVIDLLGAKPLLRDAIVRRECALFDQTSFDEVAEAIQIKGDRIPDDYLPTTDATFELTPTARRFMVQRIERLLPVAQPGARVYHHEFGDGIVVDVTNEGYARVFFASSERLVPISKLTPTLGWADRVINNVAGTPERARQALLVHEAFSLPLMESAAALTAAPIDLLPHQVVLTHRIATASPRRYLIADEVGLGKTIEAALLLRELASRGELTRALMWPVVPSG